jgi:hypothetical protein
MTPWGSRAGDRVRTGDIQLGKLALYQLSYARSAAKSGGGAGERQPRYLIRYRQPVMPAPLPSCSSGFFSPSLSTGTVVSFVETTFPL